MEETRGEKKILGTLASIWPLGLWLEVLITLAKRAHTMIGKKWQGGDSRAQELCQEQGLSKGQGDVRVSLKLSTLHA